MRISPLPPLDLWLSPAAKVTHWLEGVTLAAAVLDSEAFFYQDSLVLGMLVQDRRLADAHAALLGAAFDVDLLPEAQGLRVTAPSLTVCFSP